MSFDSYNLRRVLPLLRAESPTAATVAMAELGIVGDHAEDLAAARQVYHHVLSLSAGFGAIVAFDDDERTDAKVEMLKARLIAKVDESIDGMLDSLEEDEVLRRVFDIDD